MRNQPYLQTGQRKLLSSLFAHVTTLRCELLAARILKFKVARFLAARHLWRYWRPAQVSNL
jgi:hypothetical protein